MKKLCAAAGLMLFAAFATAQEPADLRASLRALAKKGADVVAAPEWAELAKTKAAGLPAKPSKGAAADKTKLVSAEIDAWRLSPDEKVSMGRFPCSAAVCKGLKVKGALLFKAYFSDGFTLRLDEAGSIIDLSYPAEYTRRGRLRARALALRPREMRLAAEWGGFIKELKAEPRGQGDAAGALMAELAKWQGLMPENTEAAVLACTAAPDYCKALGIAGAEYNRVSFDDGFVLVLDGVKPADCFYKAQQQPAPVVSGPGL